MLVAIPCSKRKSIHNKNGSHIWVFEYIGLFFVFVFYFVAWGFGLPATNPLNLGVTRPVFQVIFIGASFLLGLTLFIFYCLLSRQIRESWKTFFSSFIPGRSKKYKLRSDHPGPITEHVDENIYVEETGKNVAPGISETAGGDISFVLDANTLSYVNPMAEDVMDEKPAMEVGQNGTSSDPEDVSNVKLDVARPDDEEEEQLKDTKL